MNTDVPKKTINLSRRILGKIDKIYPPKKGYKWLFDYIRFSLRKEFKQTNDSYEINNTIHQPIPYKFWVMWWQGLDDAPTLIRQNIYRLEKRVGKENVTVITKDNCEEYTDISEVIIREFKKGNISYTSLSDIIRFNILKSYGGFWIDSTVALSDKFFKYFNEIKKEDFFSICNKNHNYHNISFSIWTIWFIGGVPGYDLFSYLDKFYEVYYSRHSETIDYFLTDDIISYYYLKNKDFRTKCENLSQVWYPYYFNSNFNAQFSSKYFDKFNNDLKYSVQKLTYKYDKSILNDKKSVLYTLNKNNWDLDNL